VKGEGEKKVVRRRGFGECCVREKYSGRKVLKTNAESTISGRKKVKEAEIHLEVRSWIYIV
jgi:hypothetical protein